MNNSGFNGTGTAFILYILLAFCMPLVFLYRLAKHRRDYGRQFVFGHFILGLLVTSIAVLVIGYAWRLLALSKGGDIHHGLVFMAYFAIVTILAWVVIPRIVRLSYRMSHKRSQLNYMNPNIHPWFAGASYNKRNDGMSPWISRLNLESRPQPPAKPTGPLIKDIF